MPALGVEGSAYATVLAQMIGAIVIISYSFLTQKSFNLKLFHPLKLKLFKKILQIGLPQGIGDSIELIAWAIFSIMVAQLLYLPGLAIGMASASYMGRFLGTKQPELAKITTIKDNARFSRGMVRCINIYYCISIVTQLLCYNLLQI
jgi:MATE family multidrug resistance protein